MEIDSKITNFEDAGTINLNLHNFVSEKFANKPKVLNVASLASNSVDEAGDSEQKVSFRINQTGNIFYSTTTPELTLESKKLFNSVTVLFAAMTKALGEKGLNLFNYEAVASLIQKSGYFVEVQKFQKNLSIKSGSLSIDTQIIQQLIPGLTSGASLDIAKGVLGALNGEFSASSSDEKVKIAHLLFICEELFGAPSVTVRLFYATKETHKTLTSSPCHKSSSVSFELNQEASTFLFVSPDTIAEFSQKFETQPEEYKNLIEKLKGYLP
uniref:Zygote formation protein zyg1 n=2 Tax=Dictyostelium mucoroides TaxID=31287 RepID=ZYG1_DICMU|nr:RecName: Full=Zygote formation protein zyg1 [Dictyostelium mucoroides]BAC87708.1 zyg1 [Dictyostelium mucoroides]BAO57385.1 ZYG1 [Dictyostelium mucoroides]